MFTVRQGVSTRDDAGTVVYIGRVEPLLYVHMHASSEVMC
jgi:hypothetical protein